jgi:phospholipid/cholesterol/gamma-HCH transport system substrate-binding protein
MRNELKIGIIVLVAIALFIFGFNFLKGVNVLKNETKIYAVFDYNDGLLEASPLLVNGYKIGQINKLQLIQRDTSFKILATFILSEKISIPKNSIARLISQDLLGTKAVAIEMGNAKEFVTNGDTLKTAFQENLTNAVRAELQPLKEKISGLVGSMDSVVQIVNEIMNRDVRKNLIESFSSIKNAVIALEQSTGKINMLMDEQQGSIASIISRINSITKNISDNNDKIAGIIENFEVISDSIARSNIKQTIESTNKALSQANLLLDEITKGQGTAGKLINDPSLYNNLNKSAQDLDMLLKDLRYNPERYLHFSVLGRKTPLKPIPTDSTSK